MKADRLLAMDEPDAERAFFVADLSQVYRQHERWRKVLPGVLPFYGLYLFFSSYRDDQNGDMINIYFFFSNICQRNLPAVKCNPDPYVLRLLAALGTGFDCASMNEITQVLSLGVGAVDPSRIIFANPCKAVSSVRSATRAGVDMMTFDNSDELYKIVRTNPRAKLILRILADDSKSLCALGIKFGAPLNDIPSLLAKARELHLDVIGVSFHVGSGCYDPLTYKDAVMRARTAFDMGKEAGYEFYLLDVGGGFEDALFEPAAAVLSEAIDLYFPNREEIRVIAEPGRFYVSKAFSLATHIIARRASPLPMVQSQEGSEEQPIMCEGVFVYSWHL
jgi:ornithine decarboxylase